MVSTPSPTRTTETHLRPPILALNLAVAFQPLPLMLLPTIRHDPTPSTNSPPSLSSLLHIRLAIPAHSTPRLAIQQLPLERRRRSSERRREQLILQQPLRAVRLSPGAKVAFVRRWKGRVGARAEGGEGAAEGLVVGPFFR